MYVGKTILYSPVINKIFGMDPYDIENQKDHHTINELDGEPVNKRSNDEEVCIYKTLTHRILIEEYSVIMTL